MISDFFLVELLFCAAMSLFAFITFYAIIPAIHPLFFRFLAIALVIIGAAMDLSIFFLVAAAISMVVVAAVEDIRKKENQINEREDAR